MADSSELKVKRSRSLKSRSNQYRYMVCPGNNSRVMLGVFRRRPWWMTSPRRHSLPSHESTIPKGNARKRNRAQSAKMDNTIRPNVIWEMYYNPRRYRPAKSDGTIEADRCCINHFENNSPLVTKKGLYWSLKQYFQAQDVPLPTYVPETFHLVGGGADDQSLTEQQRLEWVQFLQSFANYAEKPPSQSPNNVGGSSDSGFLPPINPPRPKSGKGKQQMTNIWIVKPATLSNRGSGIQVVTSIEQVSDIVSKSMKSSKRSRGGFIVQKYIEKPLLVRGRKFDIRCYLLLVSHPRDGSVSAYIYDDGYIRTSSSKYTLSTKSQANRLVHLTNDGIQKNSKGYGKFEQGNKLSYDEFSEYIDANYPERQGWCDSTMKPEIERILAESVMATHKKINPNKRKNSFELLGCDFMVTDSFELQFIEVNSNPCLEFSNEFLESFIPQLLEHTIQLTVDVFFPPPSRRRSTKSAVQAIEALSHSLPENKFKPIFPVKPDP